MDWIDEAAMKAWDYINDADRPETGEDAIKEVASIIRARAPKSERAIWLLCQILLELPYERDWLDPDIEREARELVKK